MPALGLCQARIAHLREDGTDRCRREAVHKHYAIETGTHLVLCTQHYQALRHRESLGSSEYLLDVWMQRVL